MSFMEKFIGRVVFSLALLLICGILRAQRKDTFPKISLGLIMNFPTGETAKTYLNGYGVSGEAEYKITKSINLTGSLGYINLRYRDEIIKRLENQGEKITGNGLIPIKVGTKYYFGGIYYAAIHLGIANAVKNKHMTSFSYGPALGAYLPFTRKFGADFGLQYEVMRNATQNLSFFSLRMAFAINN